MGHSGGERGPSRKDSERATEDYRKPMGTIRITDFQVLDNRRVNS
jgi:hypothetical protein